MHKSQEELDNERLQGEGFEDKETPKGAGKKTGNGPEIPESEIDRMKPTGE